MTKKKIYFISETFPPLGRGGAIVRAYFAKYLQEDGWPIKVITTGVRKGFFLDWVTDHSLYDTLKEKMEIIIVPPTRFAIIGEVLSTLKIWPSMFSDWAKRVIKRLPEIVDPDQGGIIFANYPDFANFQIAYAMKEKYNFPLALDFRDDFFDTNVESVVQKADLIFTTTETLKLKIQEKFQVPAQHIQVIYNGYHEPAEDVLPQKGSEKLRIVYAGTIARHQKPEILNLAYARACEKYPGLKDKVKIIAYGQKNYYYHMFYKRTIREGIDFRGFIGHEQLMQTLKDEIDIGFFSLADDRYSYATPTKLFEYINLELPILAALPDGEAKSIITQNDLGIVVPSGNIDALAEAINQLATQKDVREKFINNAQKVKHNFSSKAQVMIMSQKLKEVFDGS